MSTEADTCRQYLLRKLYETGWTDDQISQERVEVRYLVGVGDIIGKR